MTAVHEMSPIDKQILHQVAVTLSELLPNIVIEEEYNVSGKRLVIPYEETMLIFCLLLTAKALD